MWFPISVFVFAVGCLILLRLFLSFDAARFFDPLPGLSGELLQPTIAAVVTVLVLTASSYVILSGAFDGGPKWALGAVGFVVGYWLRPPGSAPLRLRGG
jgi:hypothetical protein